MLNQLLIYKWYGQILKKQTNNWNNNYIKYEISGDRNKNLSVKEYLDKIKPYLRDMIINFKKSGTLKIHLTITINFISSKNVDRRATI